MAAREYLNNDPIVNGNGQPITWFQSYINGTFQSLRDQLAGITQAQTTANTAQTAATAAQTTANTALTTANAAEAGIANLANLGVLTAAQKATTLIPDAAQLEALYSLITTRANALSITHTALDTAHTNWLTLLNSYSPAWNDTTQDTTIYTTALPTSEQAFPVGWTASAGATSSVTGAYVQLNDPSTTQFSNYFTATLMPCSSGQSVSAGIVVKKSASHTTNWAVLRLIVNNTGGNYYADVAFNPYNGAVVAGTGALPAGVTLGYDVLDLGTEWYVRNTLINLDSTSSTFWVQIYPAICNDGDTFVAYDATKTGNILVRGCPDVAVGDWTKLGHNEILARYNAVVLAAQALSNQISAADASTALWGSVTGPNRPADNATQNIVYYSSTTPSTPNNGDLWVDTSVSPNVTRARVSGAWQLAANLTTNTNQLTDGAGLGTTATWSGVTGTGTPETNADVTSIITGPSEIVIKADYTGAVTTAMPFAQQYTLTALGVDVTTSSTTWSMVVNSGTMSASIGATTGILSINTSSGSLTSGSVTITAVHGGNTRSYFVKITLQSSAPPSGGGGGSGTSQYFTIGGGPSSTTLAACGTELDINVGSSGQASLSADYTFSAAGSNSCAVQFYRWNGSSWVALGSVSSSVVYNRFSDQAELFYSVTVTGLTANSAQRFMLYWKEGNTTNNISGSCDLSAVGS